MAKKPRTNPASRSQAPEGIAPSLLRKQVENTAAWSLAESSAPPTEYDNPAAPILLDVTNVEAHWRKGTEPLRYLRFLLAAHYSTVATFVPTDVDARIREHAWTSLPREHLAQGMDIALEAAAWDIRAVSVRYVEVDGALLSGHRGEWFSVVAAALGRALVLGEAEQIARATAFIDDEIAREQRQFEVAQKSGDAQLLLSTATIIAHNLGDLSRVVDTWKSAHQASTLGQKYHRLGFQEGSPFLAATELNKDRMAIENHRFLTLRVPRSLRRARSLLLPIGPYFYAWGKLIGKTPLLDDDERAEVLLALLQMHARRTQEHGCLRAIAGMDQAVQGGLSRLTRRLPAREQSLALLGGVREALRQSDTSFLNTFHAGLGKR
jgi:hypothetical protein